MPRWALVFWRQRGIEIDPSAPGEFPGIAVGSADGKQVLRRALVRCASSPVAQDDKRLYQREGEKPTMI
jgi:hypothetical protein